MALTKVSTAMFDTAAQSSDLNIDANTLFVDVSTNRVGIGTTTPSVPLEVSGQLKAGGITYPTSDGTNGQALVTNGSGVASFATVAPTAGTGVTVSGTTVSIGQAVATSSNVTFNDLVVAGNLTVNGSTVTNSATNTTIEDILIELGTGTSGSPANDAGLVLERGSSDNVFIGWDESADTFTVGTGSFTGASSGNLTITPATAVFGGLTVDTSTLVVDASNNRVGIGNASPDVSLDIGSFTDAVHMPVGTTGQRPGSPAAGYFRYNSTLGKFEGYTTAWGEIGGGGSNTFTTDVYTTSNASTTAFTLSQSVDSVNDLIVFVDGVFQVPTAAYTVSGTTLTMTAAPASGRKVVAYSVKHTVSGSNLNQNSFTGNGSAVAFTLGTAPVNENNTQVFLDGVYQHKATYATSGTTLTFDAAPASGVAIEVMVFTQTDINVPVDGTITTAKIVDDAITSAKIADDAVGNDQLASGLTLGGTTTATLASGAQGGITAVGTLTSLTSSGNITANNLSVTSTNWIGFGDYGERISGSNANSSLTLYTDATAALHMDSSQRKLFGHTTSQSFVWSSVQPQLQLEGTNASGASISITRNDNSASPPYLILAKSRGGSVNSNTTVVDDDQTGSIMFVAADGTDRLTRTAEINSFVDGTPGSNDTPGRLEFKTTKDGNVAPTAAMTIDSSQRVGIGTTAPERHLVLYGTAASTTSIQFQNADTGAAAGDGFGVGLDSAEKGFIWNYEGTDTYIGGAGGTSITVQNGGNVGIKQTTPVNLLHIGGADGDSYARFTSDSTGHTSGDGTRIGLNGTDFRIVNHEASNILFLTSNTERMRIDSTGTMTMNGAAGTSPRFEMINNDSEDTDTGRETSLRFSGHRSGGEDVVNAQISGHHNGSADDNKGLLLFSTNNGSSGLAEGLRIDSDQVVHTAGDFKPGADVIMASGRGISFAVTSDASGTGVAMGSELLDDYEEGTWSPILIAGTTNPTGGSSIGSDGEYIKIGNRVWVTFYIGRSWTNSPSGTIYVSRLPFTVNANRVGYHPVTTHQITFGDSGFPFLIPSTSSDSAALYYSTSGGSWNALTWQSHAASSSGIYVSGSFSYLV